MLSFDEYGFGADVGRFCCAAHWVFSEISPESRQCKKKSGSILQGTLVAQGKHYELG